MPGVIMENGGRSGAHTNHDRDQRPNGISITNHGSEKIQDKGKGREEPLQNMTPTSPILLNGLNGNMTEKILQNQGNYEIPKDVQKQISQLPPEIIHITQGYMSLKTLLARQSQKTHHNLLATINELAQMPGPASLANGNSAHTTSLDDNSSENINKKLRLLKFATDQHEAWTKTLVITGWSRRADDVSKIIDLKCHLDTQRQYYEEAIAHMSTLAKNLFHARLPNPDLKTAVEVLTTGRASWMPDLGYIRPPPLTAREVHNSLLKLNTILSMRLNLYDYDSIPLQFKDYTIKSGRVTFKVPGEFEVDLTVADEDKAAQFWFLDLRFQFWPSPDTLTPMLRPFIENKVNGALFRDGLAGCYKFLHEMILTHKINEFRTQAIALSRGKWIETLKVEPLQRALSIQYWLDRYNKGPKSWIILGVHSGKREGKMQDPKATSRLFLRWFRDGKEMKEVDIPFDTVNISAEALLKAVIAKHINHILMSTFEKLQEKPLYANHELALSLSISDSDPADTELSVQVTRKHQVSVRIHPVNGRFVLGPASRSIFDAEYRLNNGTHDPANDAHNYVEYLRYTLISEDLISHALTVGWLLTNNPGLKMDELKKVMSKDNLRILWFRRAGWVKDWYMAVGLSMRGERWVLLQTANVNTTLNPNGLVIQNFIEVPLQIASPIATYGFLTSLSIFTAALMSQHANLKALYTRRAAHTLIASKPSKAISLPAICAKLSDILPSKNRSARTNKAWASDVVRLTFQGVELSPPTLPQNVNIVALQGQEQSLVPSLTGESAVLITEARMIVPFPKDLGIITERVDRDIAFHPETGSFAFRLRSNIGEPVIHNLVERAIRVERLVDFVQVLEKHKKTLKCVTVSLGKIIFTYKTTPPAKGPGINGVDDSSEVYKATVDFSAKEETIVILLERGNPHLRIVDYLNLLINDQLLGLDTVAKVLGLTLSINRGLDAIEAAWASDAVSQKGDVFVNVRASDWYMIRYSLDQPPIQGSPQPRRKVVFEVRLRHRRGEPWWWIRRIDNTREKEQDELDQALKPLWTSFGPSWKGLKSSAVGEGKGAEDLLVKLDELVRKFALGDSVITLAPARAPAAPPAQAHAPSQSQRPSQRPMLQQQRQQQPTPNQSQNSNRGIKREVIDLDD